MNSAGRSNISSIFQHGLQDGYFSLNPHVKGGLFPLRCKESFDMRYAIIHCWPGSRAGKLVGAEREN